MMSRSEELFARAVKRIPGGVNSPVRAYQSVGMTPRFIQGASGPYVFDVDGRQYIDYILSWGPMMQGHNNQEILQAVVRAAENGLSFGAATETEVEMAELLCENIPHLEMVRMVNSGTEAVMSAVRAARGFTGRNKIIKFMGCYHGHSDAMLVKAGSGVMTAGVPDSAGVPEGCTRDTLSAVYNDLDSAAPVSYTHLDVYKRQAVTAAKRVKTEVTFSRANETAMDQALRLLKEKAFSVKGKTCMVIGNGEMGRLAAQTLRQAGADVTVTVRQYRSGVVEIPVGCRRINYGERMEFFPSCDLVVSATASPNFTLTRELVAASPAKEHMILIDLAVPRDMEPSIGELPGIDLYNIDDFKMNQITPQVQKAMEPVSYTHLDVYKRQIWGLRD